MRSDGRSAGWACPRGCFSYDGPVSCDHTRGGRGTSRSAPRELGVAELRAAFDALQGVPGAGAARQKIAELLCEARGKEIARLQERRARAALEADEELALARVAEQLAWRAPHGAGSVVTTTSWGHRIVLPV